MTSSVLGMKLNSVRNHNIMVIMSFLYQKPHSCLELSKKIGISDVGVRKIIRELEDLNLVKRASNIDAVKTRGNQHIRYTLNRKVGYFLFIDYTQFKERFYLLDFKGSVLVDEKFTIPVRYQSDDEINQLIELICKTLEEKGFSKDKIVHTVIGITGQVDEENRFLVFSKLFNKYKGDAVKRMYEIFENGFGTPVTIKNNVMIMAMGEGLVQSKEKHVMALYVYAGFGISTSILYQGEPLLASRGYAGEIGGNQMGVNFTLSSACSLYALINGCRDMLEEPTLKGLINGYNTNQAVKDIVLNSAKLFGTSLLDFVTSLGADWVVLSGEVVELGKEYLEIIETKLSESMYTPKFSLSKVGNPFVLGALDIARRSYVTQLLEKVV